MERITSRTNPLMTHIRRIAASRSYRRERGEYLGDGSKLLEEALRWKAGVKTVVFTPEVSVPPLPEGVRAVEVPRDVMKSVSPMEAPQGVLFLAALPEQRLPRLTGRRYLALEGVQDPGNVGTMLRTADALGAGGVILLEGCADPYNPKTVRAAMGALFRCGVWQTDLPQLCEALKETALPLYGAALGRDTEDAGRMDLRRGVLLIGSEGRGLSREALTACQRTIRIPMRPRCESLNAAAAAAILLWEGWRQESAGLCPDPAGALPLHPTAF